MVKTESSIKNIYICGFSLSGKSQIGKALAKKLKREFIDTDLEIAVYKKNPWKMISIIGENKFRERERKLIDKLIKRKKLIVALGGGILPNKKILDSGICIFLNRKFSSILCELSKSSYNRPLLESKDPQERKNIAQKLFKKRLKYYKKSHVEIKFSDIKKEHIVKLIKEKLDEIQNLKK